MSDDTNRTAAEELAQAMSHIFMSKPLNGDPAAVALFALDSAFVRGMKGIQEETSEQVRKLEEALSDAIELADRLRGRVTVDRWKRECEPMLKAGRELLALASPAPAATHKIEDCGRIEGCPIHDPPVPEKARAARMCAHGIDHAGEPHPCDGCCKPEVYTRPRELRDEFAMAALTGLIVQWNSGPMDEKVLAAQAYVAADAMMEARKQR